MHKSPDKEIRKKLSAYTEEPNEDLWLKIMDAVHPPRQAPAWIEWTHPVAMIISVLALITLVYTRTKQMEKQSFVAEHEQVIKKKNNSLPTSDSITETNVFINKYSSEKLKTNQTNTFENTSTAKDSYKESSTSAIRRDYNLWALEKDGKERPLENKNVRPLPEYIAKSKEQAKTTPRNKSVTPEEYRQVDKNVLNKKIFQQSHFSEDTAKALIQNSVDITYSVSTEKQNKEELLLVGKKRFTSKLNDKKSPSSLSFIDNDRQNERPEINQFKKEIVARDTVPKYVTRTSAIYQDSNRFFKNPLPLMISYKFSKKDLNYKKDSFQKSDDIKKNIAKTDHGAPIIINNYFFTNPDSLPPVGAKIDSDSTKIKNKRTSTQDESITEKHSHSHNKKFYFLGMPTLGYQRIETNRNDNIYIERVKNISNLSFKRLGIRLEAGVEIPISKHFQLNGGILYYQRKQTLEYVEKVLDSMAVSSSTEQTTLLSPQFSYSNKTYEYEVKNIGLHISINYKLSENKFLHLIGAGLEFHKSIQKNHLKTQTIYVQDPSVYLFYNLYYRLQYPVEGRFKAIFQPTLNYSFYFNKDLNAPFYVKPYGLGLNIGFTYAF